MLHCSSPQHPRYIRKGTVLAAAKDLPVAMEKTRQMATAYLASRREQSGICNTPSPHSFPELALKLLEESNEIGQDNGLASQPKQKFLELALDLSDCGSVLGRRHHGAAGIYSAIRVLDTSAPDCIPGLSLRRRTRLLRVWKMTLKSTSKEM